MKPFLPFAVAIALGCGGESPTATIRFDVVGTYTLTEVNGSSVGSDETAGVTVWTAPAGCSVDNAQGQTTRVISPGGEFALQPSGSFALGLAGWRNCLINDEIASRSYFGLALRGSYQVVANELILVLNDEFDIHIERGLAEPQPGNPGIAGSIVLFMSEDALNANHEYNLRYVRQ